MRQARASISRHLEQAFYLRAWSCSQEAWVASQAELQHCSFLHTAHATSVMAILDAALGLCAVLQVAADSNKTACLGVRSCTRDMLTQ